MARSTRPDPSRAGHPLPPATLFTTELGSGPRVVLAHGFTQTGRSWGPVGSMLADRFRVVLADLPGHGRSGNVRASVEEGAALLGAACGRAAYLGYSMGGRHCLRLALDHPELVMALVLVSTSAGIVDPDDRRARRAADEALADRLDPPARPETSSWPGAPGRPGSAQRPGPRRETPAVGERERLDAFLDDWLAGPLFAHLSPEVAGLDARRENTCAGLAASLRLAGAGAMEPLWERLGTLSVPTLLVVGEDDRRYREIAERMVTAAGGPTELAIVAGTGHAVPLEAPAALAALSGGFLDRVLRGTSPD